MEIGWDSYDAPPPNATARYWAEQMLHLLSEVQFRPDRVAPSVEGGVAIAWRRGSKNANIEFFNSGEILIATRDKMGKPLIEEFFPDDLREAMELIRGYVNP
ncbi:MAG: hypothetical protein M3Y56_10035 [Armatimonadota bacterium]|nr:hypothetical protein [Armatimonadota bacterium]